MITKLLKDFVNSFIIHKGNGKKLVHHDRLEEWLIYEIQNMALDNI